MAYKVYLVYGKLELSLNPTKPFMTKGSVLLFMRNKKKIKKRIEELYGKISPAFHLEMKEVK